ncbi:MAG: hypothetical protein RMJ98_08680 [Myxococcales bacterium]|nr:hypothetical protein [Polyangiaceae bacterium]MDW8249363.1 hypothetical protein [Myxococcales bacterium]
MPQTCKWPWFWWGVAVLLIVVCPREAHAWIETTVLSDDVRLLVERNGSAVVEHQMTLRVRGSPMRMFVLGGVDADAQPEGAAVAIPQRDGASAHVEDQVPLAVMVTPDGGLRLQVDDPKGLPRGTYLLKFRYRTDLVRTGALEKDGTMVKLRWLGARLPNGVDSAKTVVVVPSAPTEPTGGERGPDLGLSSIGAFLTTTRRFPDRDEIELVRPHVAKAEQVAWSVRLDPRSLGAVNDPRIRPPPSTAVRAILRSESRERQVFLAVAAGVAILFTALTAIKGRQVELAARAAGLAPRPLFPAPSHVRAFLAGPAVALGVGLQLLLEPPAVGTVVLVGAMLLMAHRTPLPRPTSRGPGRWLALSEAEAFVPAPKLRDTWLDVSTREGKVGLVLTCLAVGVAAAATFQVSPYHANLLVLDALMLVALFFTGRCSELAPSLVRGPAGLLQRLHKELCRRAPGARIVPWARFPQGQSEPDELRLMILPKGALRGLHGIEVGYAFAVGSGGVIACPEVLVRVAEDTEAAHKARSLAPFGRWVHGRKAGELVLSLEPRSASWRSVVGLVGSLLVQLAEERNVIPGKEPATMLARRGERKVAAARPVVV